MGSGSDKAKTFLYSTAICGLFIFQLLPINAYAQHYNPASPLYDGKAPQYKGACPVAAPTVSVDVRAAAASSVPLDNTRSVYDLESQQIDGTVASRNRAEYQVSGLTKGMISVDRQISFKTSADTQTGEGCVWPEKISVIINLANTIFIANKYNPGTCEYRETYNHEIKHVNADRVIVNRYLPYMRSQVEMVANMQGVQGPAPASQLKEAKSKMTRYIWARIDEVINKLQADRSAMQNNIDSVSEYKRVSSSCRNF